ncbi:MAG: T9SS type A sorting domain-containing protein [Chitinophagaceae bacterium]|nr:T9SS type A sorting domain-containing protein [Chitinophagaceae bacterium]
MNKNLKLQIAEPCHENWNKMSQQEQGRFCQSCSKTVIDFSFMHDREIVNQIYAENGSVCGRFSNHQLNRTLNPAPATHRAGAYAWTAVIAAMLSVGAAQSQTKPERATRGANNKRVVQQRDTFAFGEVAIQVTPKLQRVKGILLDEKTLTPIPFGKIVIKGTESKVTADADGCFVLPVLFSTGDVAIGISADNYEDQEYSISPSSTGIKTFYLRSNQLTIDMNVMDTLMIDSVFLNEYPMVTMGMIIMKEEVPIVEKFERQWADWKSKLVKSDEIKLFPNPAKRGSDINLELNLPVGNQYTLDIISDDGRIIHVEQLFVSNSYHRMSLYLQPAWGSGVYWVRIKSKSSSKMYHAKFVL